MNLLKKYNFIILGLIIVFFLFSFPHPALAFWQELANAVYSIPFLLPAVVLAIVVFLSNIFASITGALLDWVTSPGFISLSYTNPANNEVIRIGLGITKQFVNLGLVVFLIFIALAIALRLKEYATQKTLARLVIIALLVNFAPVICGLIVDAANIVMNFFLVGIREGVSGILTGLGVGSIVTDLSRTVIGSVSEKFSLMAKALVMIILNLGIGFAFLLFAAIFLFRYIAIWLLVILSPLAFVAWILPATKKFWDMWWKQFISWSTVGIPIAFFLYLGMASFRALEIAFRAKMTLPGLEPAISGLIDTILPYFVTLALLFLGFGIGLKTSAMGSTALIKGFQAAHKRARSRTLKAIGRGTMTAPRALYRGGERLLREAQGIGDAYRTGRGGRLTRIQAARNTVRVYWEKRALPAGQAIKRGGQTIKRTVTTKAGAKAGAKDWKAGKPPGSRGFLNAIRDITGTGWKAAMKPPKKTRGKTEEGKDIEITEE